MNVSQDCFQVSASSGKANLINNFWSVVAIYDRKLFCLIIPGLEKEKKKFEYKNSFAAAAAVLLQTKINILFCAFDSTSARDDASVKVGLRLKPWLKSICIHNKLNGPISLPTVPEMRPFA